ncbi:succinylglutamate desuccinylase/aspartoacylase domain-containing protein [Saliphagus infecundisoli]|uniref:Succinylglutamate desuccinylase/aspartoacylase family protein n=1 Tax=Saliphagus infecundisoli TaxID=1849069 RepID=A0ABD5QFI6_9EURY|nr:succinylglutamate desuccinylase/aspartoacylase family protein [Saliphagus infecundisoli]
MTPLTKKAITSVKLKMASVGGDKNLSRRRVLAGTAGVLVGAGGMAGSVSASESCAVSNFSYTIHANTPYKTTVHVIEGQQAGPTALVVGGMHGDEVAGYEAGNQILDWQIDRGTLVMLPEADVDAINRGTRHGSVGYLNRQFPTGREPTSGLAQDIWGVVEMHEPDVVIDMHSSRGIWGTDTEFDGYGQAVFSAPSAVAREPAERTVNKMNERFLGSYPDSYDFTVGETIDGSEPMLAHKVVGELNRPGYIVEVTEDNTDLSTQIQWTKSVVTNLLRAYGLETSYASEHF